MAGIGCESGSCVWQFLPPNLLSCSFVSPLVPAIVSDVIRSLSCRPRDPHSELTTGSPLIHSFLTIGLDSCPLIHYSNLSVHDSPFIFLPTPYSLKSIDKSFF